MIPFNLEKNTMSRRQFINTGAAIIIFLCPYESFDFKPDKATLPWLPIINSKVFNQKLEAVEKALALITSSPTWSSLAEDETEGRQHITENLEKISKFDIETIRKAVRAYAEQFPTKATEHNSYNSHMSRLFVLNRFIFKVPTTPLPIKEIKHFGGWIGRPHQECETVWSWPFSVNSKGGFQLTGTLEMYMGTLYQPIAEFEYLYHTFGLRYPPQHIEQK
jgi:hypothetical protein